MEEKLQIDIEDILNGNFGTIEKGMTRSEVISILGEPSEIREGKYHLDICYLIYGGYALFFREENKVFRLKSFENTWLDEDEKYLSFENDKIKITPWFLKFGMGFKEVIQELEQRNIEHTFTYKYDELFIILKDNATIGFAQNENNQQVLFSIGYQTEF